MTSIREDIETVFRKDPAARSIIEVITCYPGLHAVWLHWIAHLFWNHDMKFVARAISHINRFLTGIEIHPGAKIGKRLFIDHGMGVLIGETAEIGNDVLIYKGVTLGGTSLEKRKRHPTIGDDVIIGTGATILGPVIIGKGAKIGAGSVVVHPVPEGATIIGVPGRIADYEPTGGLQTPERDNLPDPVQKIITSLLVRQNELEERIQLMEKMLNENSSHDIEKGIDKTEGISRILSNPCSEDEYSDII